MKVIIKGLGALLDDLGLPMETEIRYNCEDFLLERICGNCNDSVTRCSRQKEDPKILLPAVESMIRNMSAIPVVISRGSACFFRVIARCPPLMFPFISGSHLCSTNFR